MLGGGWSDSLVHPALEIGFAEMATLAVIVAVRLDASHVLLHDRLALAFTTNISREIHGLERREGRRNLPSWSSGNEPRSGGETLKSENVGGRPNDMLMAR